MDRRDFLKETAAAVVALSLTPAGAGGAQQQGDRLTLENDQVEWEFSLNDKKFSALAFTNKLSGKRYPLRNATELQLTFSAAVQRIEIPWWQCTFGPNPSLAGDSQWDYCIHPCLPAVSDRAGLPHNQNRPAIVYPGYGWFRATFELPAAAQGEEVVLNLGGYDQTDWNEYQVSVNGIEVGSRRNTIYGYSYFDGGHGFIFLNNVSFARRTIKLELGETLGLKPPAARTIRLRVHFPEEAILVRERQRDFPVGEAIEIGLRPFEVILLEVTVSDAQPAVNAEPAAAERELIEKTPVYSYAVPISPAALRKDLQLDFADDADLRRRGCARKASVSQATLPAYAKGRYHLAVVCTFKKDGQSWRQKIMSDFVQTIACVAGVYMLKNGGGRVPGRCQTIGFNFVHSSPTRRMLLAPREGHFC